MTKEMACGLVARQEESVVDWNLSWIATFKPLDVKQKHSCDENKFVITANGDLKSAKVPYQEPFRIEHQITLIRKSNSSSRKRT